MSEEKKVYYTESTKKAAEKYKARNIKRIPLDVQKDQYIRIQAAAAAVGESVNGYIKGAIFQRMDREQEGNRPEE